MLQVERSYWEEGSTSNMKNLSFVDESPREREVGWWRAADGGGAPPTARGPAGAGALSAGSFLTG